MKDNLKKKFIIILLIFFVFFSLEWLISYLPLADPLQINIEKRLSPPGSHFVLGSDELGRDVLSRMLHGAATTVCVSSFALLSSLFLGTLFGGVAGYCYKTWLDKIFNWVVSLIFSVPFLLIMVSVLSMVEQNLFNAYLILTLMMWVNPARIVRAEVIRTRNKLFVRALRAQGASEVRILFQAILPSCVYPSIIFSIAYFPEIVGLEAGLSFLGLGVQPPHPGLGKMIFDGLNYLYSAWWIALAPAGLLGLIVITVNKIVGSQN